MATKYSKVEVLTNYWDKMIGQIQQRSTQLKDDVGSQLVLKFLLVPKDV